MAQTRWMIGMALTTTLLTGCGGSSDNKIDDNPDNGGSDNGGDGITRMVVDASSSDTMAYLNLASGEVLNLTAAQAAESEDWHLALRRYNIQLNGGASGPGAVVGVVGDDQADFYDDSGEPVANVFLNATPDSELEHLKDTFTAPARWSQDSVVSGLGEAWYNYDHSNGNMSANSDNGYLLRSGEGDSYARLRATEFTFPTRTGQGITSFEFSFDVQPAGTEQFTGTATFTGSIPPEGGERCFDFDSNATVDCANSENWDLVLGFADRSLYLRTNSGPSGNGDGGAFGPMTWSDLSDYTSATTDPGGNSLASHFNADSTGGVFVDHGWYAYNLSEQHQLWPNYRVYLIDTDRNDDASPVYAVQLIGYYGDDGESGQPVLRWREVTLTEAAE